MVRTSALFFAALLLTVSFASLAVAQDYDPSGRVARIDYLRGSVSFQPAGEPDWVSAMVNRPITTGDRLWADQGARVEMHLGSSTIRLGDMTGMSFFNLDDRTTQIELSEGTLNIRVLRLGRDEVFEVDTPNQAFSILRPGEYRIDASEDGETTMVTVREGEGEVTGGGRTYTVDEGLSGNFTGSDSLRASIFRARGYDDFDDWCRDRNRRADNSPSRRYVSVDVVGYQDLDDHGYWRRDPNYGYIWVPRVTVGWAPYRYGHWVWISPWGWTWVDDAPWGFAPFHYGRWVYAGNYWGWVPGPIAVRPVYAPALVAFVGGPNFSISLSLGSRSGYVGWFPLGPREVYVPAYRTSRDYVNRVNVSNTTVNNITITNVYNNQNNRNIRYANKTAPGGVTAVSQTTFTSAQPVGRDAVAVNEREIASAPISRRAEVAPTKNSVLGNHTPGGNQAPQPPARVTNRTIVTKTPPPPPPVPFEKQQAKLAAQPGQPLESHDIENLRPTAAGSSERSRVRQAPPGRSAPADSSEAPANLPGNARSAPGSTPGIASPPQTNNAPARENRPPRGNSRDQQSNAQAPAQVPAPASSSPSGNNAQAPRENRPPSANSRSQQSNAQAPAQVPAPASSSPSGNNAQAPRENRPPSGNSRSQQSNAQAPAQVPAPSSSSPSGNSGPAPRESRPPRGNNGGQTPNAQVPAPAPAPSNPPANNAPAPREDRPSRGRSQQPEAQAPAQAPAPSNPPANNAPAPREDRPSRGRGQQPEAQAPAQTPAPAPGNTPSKEAPPANGRGKQPSPPQSNTQEEERDRR